MHLNGQKNPNLLKEEPPVLQKSFKVDDATVQAVFRERAQRLARRRKDVKKGVEILSVLTIKLKKETYGVPLTLLEEIRPLKKCTTLFGVRKEVLGMMNVRGNVRLVVDMAQVLGLPEAEKSQGYVLLLNNQGHHAGLRVDGIDKISKIAVDELITPEGGGLAVPVDYVKGVTPDSLIVLNFEAMLSHPVFEVV